MAQYIDKAAVVAEIERRIQECDNLANAAADNNLSNTLQANELLIRQYKSLLNFIDTIETKEVDLENAVKGRIDYPLIGADFPNIYPNYRELKDYCDKNGIKDEDKVKIIITKTL